MNQDIVAGDKPPSRSLLGSQPLILAADRDHMANELRRSYKVNRVGFAKTDIPFVGVANRIQLGPVGLHYCRYDVPTEIEFSDMAGFRQFFCLSGSSQIKVAGGQIDIDRLSSGIIPPESDFEAHYSEYYSHLVVQFSEQQLLQKAELIMGRDFSGSLLLPTLQNLPVEKITRVRSIAVSLAQQFAEDVNANDLSIVELAQALTSSFLIENMRNFSEILVQQPKLAAKHDVDRLEDYIRANWDKPLTVEDVASACDTSVRSVFTRFKQERGVTPMAYVRDVRLSQANRLLREGDGNISVIDVALKCGFSSLGHFAKRYKDKFGELPSVSATRRRSQALM
jgi:AraC-like DNA-binding protein